MIAVSPISMTYNTFSVFSGTPPSLSLCSFGATKWTDTSRSQTPGENMIPIWKCGYLKTLLGVKPHIGYNTFLEINSLETV